MHILSQYFLVQILYRYHFTIHNACGAVSNYFHHVFSPCLRLASVFREILTRTETRNSTMTGICRRHIENDIIWTICRTFTLYIIRYYSFYFKRIIVTFREIKRTFDVYFAKTIRPNTSKLNRPLPLLPLPTQTQRLRFSAFHNYVGRKKRLHRYIFLKNLPTSSSAVSRSHMSRYDTTSSYLRTFTSSFPPLLATPKQY